MDKYLEASPNTGKQFYQNFKDKEPIVMLNLLKFKPTANYTCLEEYLKPEKDISGEEAYRLYLEHTWSQLRKVGDKILYFGKSKDFLIGPETENGMPCYWLNTNRS